MKYFRHIIHFSVLLAVMFFCGRMWCDLYRINQAQRHKPYRFYTQIEAQIAAKPEQKEQLLQDAVQKYKKAISWDPSNPESRFELGRLYWHLSRIKPATSETLLDQAEEALRQAVEKNPSYGKPHFYLAKVYHHQNKSTLAGQSMLIAQITIPHNLDLAKDMVVHWAKHKNDYPESVYLPLIAERLYFLNQMNFARYGKTSLAMWVDLTTKSLWGTIIPKEEKYALAAARFFIEDEIYEDFDLAQQLLDYVTSSKKIAEKYLLQGMLHLYLGKVDKAVLLCKQSINNTDNEDKKKTAYEVAKILTMAGQLPKAMSIFKETETDTQSNLLALVEYAISLGQYQQIMPYLQAAEKRFPTSKLYFFLSMCYAENENIYKAILYAEKAVQQNLRNEQFAGHYCELLFSMDMEDTASRYLQRYGHFLPRPAVFYDRLAWSYLAKRRFGEAKTWSEKAIKLEPKNQTIRIHLNEIYMRISRKKN